MAGISSRPTAANLHKMTLELVTATNEDVVASPRHKDQVVGDQSMSAFDEVEHTPPTCRCHFSR